jgi:DNA-binding response OmpR family regulator
MENLKEDTNKKPSILLVEDDPLLVTMYKTKFTHEGFDILIANDGQTGLKMAMEEEVDLILLDIMMPRLSGIDLLEALRNTPKGKKIPVIIATNLSGEEDKQKAQKLGVNDYLIKVNITPTELVSKFRRDIKS